MKNALRLICIPIIGLFSYLNLSAQEIPRSLFISLHTGSYFPTNSTFTKTYSHAQFINGLSIGCPIFNKGLYFYAKAMYFHKNGIPIIYHFSSEDGVTSIYTTQEGSVTINHFLFNLGFQYSCRINENWRISPNGGINLIKSKEKSETNNSDASGLNGFFIGLGTERSIKTLPLTIFSELQYNFSVSVLKEYGIDYSAVNLNIGIRYYLKTKKHL